MSGLLHVTCPKCGKSGDVPESFVGKGIHCKKCDAHFIVSGPAGAASPAHGPSAGHAAATKAAAPSPVEAPAMEPGLMHVSRAARAQAHALDPIPVSDPEPVAVPTHPHEHHNEGTLLDSLSDDAGLAPLTEEDEQHARQRYEARVLSKERSAHYDDHGNQLSEAEYEERKRQGRSSVH